MDGNGRWAQKHNLPRSAGHRKGVEAVRRTVRAFIELGIPYLTIYSFSSENWSRPITEVSYLMGLIKRFIRQDLADLHKHQVCIKVIGDIDAIDPELSHLIKEAVSLTANNTGLCLVVAFNYGARDEITKAIKSIAEKVVIGQLQPENINNDIVSKHLQTANIPDPDLLIRTSGEKRLSNFLLWQSAYTEFVFQDVFWPDFDKTHLYAALDEYRNRSRRFGGVVSQSTG
ncbi:MAG: isoprenyl transferase [Pseudomonadota bacterium]